MYLGNLILILTVGMGNAAQVSNMGHEPVAFSYSIILGVEDAAQRRRVAGLS